MIMDTLTRGAVSANPAMDPTGLSCGARFGAFCAGGSSPKR